MFGAKPEMIVKGGTIAYAQMGDPNASIPTPQPVMMRPMFGATCVSHGHSVAFCSQAAVSNDIRSKYGLQKPVEAVVNCRNLTKKDMVWNSATPEMHTHVRTGRKSITRTTLLFVLTALWRTQKRFASLVLSTLYFNW
jgi:urease alpha subunit